MHYPDVYLLRHGQTEWNIAGRLQGRLDSALTKTGRAQAQQQGVLLKELLPNLPDVSFFCSPLGRAQNTAAIVLDGLEHHVHTDTRLREISAGTWDGAFLTEIERTNGPLFEQARNAFELMFLAPDGEGEIATIERCQSFLSELKGPSVLVTHGATLCVLRGLLRGLVFEEMLELGHEQGCVYEIKSGCETILR